MGSWAVLITAALLVGTIRYVAGAGTTAVPLYQTIVYAEWSGPVASTFVSATGARESMEHFLVGLSTESGYQFQNVVIQVVADIHASRERVIVVGRFKCAIGSDALAVFANAAGGSTFSMMDIAHTKKRGAHVPIIVRMQVHLNPDVKISVGATTPYWGLSRINKPTLPLNWQWTLPASVNQTADPWFYIVDVGVRVSHDEFTPNRVTKIYDFNSASYDPDGCHPHATHVASVVAGNTVGVMPNSSIFDIRALGCTGGGYLSDVISGLATAHAHCVGQQKKGVVINMSLGGAGTALTSDSLAAVLVALRLDCDALTAVAAGNAGSDACGVVPAALVNTNHGRVLTVGATTIDDALATYSNRGSCVIILAPGSNITGADIDATNSYSAESGTSLATPFVAGVALALMSNRPPNWDTGNGSSLFADEVYQTIITSGTPNKIRLVPAGTRNLLLQMTQTAGAISPISPITPIRDLPLTSEAPETVPSVVFKSVVGLVAIMIAICSHVLMF